jgi:iron complex outermembrane receptor protein
LAFRYFTTLVFIGLVCAAAPARSQQERQFDITLPAVPLSDALKLVAQQTGEDILFTADSVAGIRSRTLSGRMSARVAVQMLIAGTHLEVLADGTHSLVVRNVAPATLPEENNGYDDAEPVAEPVEHVTITGTSIRDSGLVGARLDVVDRSLIQATASITPAQMLKLAPAVTGFGGSGVGQLPGTSYYAPTIHSLGASASNSTLVLIDGHRLPVGGNQHVLPDPNMVPAIAVERIEILADGSSSVYGSDAVGGVINIITRKRIDGFEADVQSGFGANYGTKLGNLLYGHIWSSGWMMGAYGYSRAANPSVDYQSRPYTDPDKTALAILNGLLAPGATTSSVTNSATFYCDPATIQMEGAGDIYTSATATVAVANKPQNSPCPFGANTPGTYNGTGAEIRHTALVKFAQNFGRRLTVSGDLDYSYRDTYTHVSAPTLQAKAFSAGPQANPLYQTPSGYNGSATSEIIRWDATKLLGYGLNDNHSQDWYIILNEEYALSRRLRLTASQMVTYDQSVVITNANTLDLSAAALALNGTTHTAGDITVPTQSGSSFVFLNLPLTTANALDVWNPAATNRTSAAVRAAITNNPQIYSGNYQLRDFSVGADGDLVELPGGLLRLALGAEYMSIGQHSGINSPNEYGPAGRSLGITYYSLDRSVLSVFAEADIPLVGPGANVPLARQVTMNISGRHDDYSDVGATTNPKVALEWEAAAGVKLRANWSTSFVAPSQRSVGDPSRDGLNVLSRVTPFTPSATVSTTLFPNIIGDPGCAAGAVTCQIDTKTPGVYRYTGNPNIRPEQGRAWNLGLDLTPDLVPGLSLSVTYFNNHFEGGVTSPQISSVLTNASQNYRLTFCNPGAPCTQTQLAAFIGNVPVVQSLPATVYYLFDQRQANALNLNVRGLDISGTYTYTSEQAGSFSAGLMATDFLAFDESLGGGTQFSVLNTSGYNTTFPSIGLQARLSLQWALNAFSTALVARHVGAYRNWSSGTINPVIVSSAGVPSGGGDPVKANITFDTHFAYELGGLERRLRNSQVYLDVSNILGSDPPFYNTSPVGNTNNASNSATTGFDAYGASNLGRVISVGLRMRY